MATRTVITNKTVFKIFIINDLFDFIFADIAKTQITRRDGKLFYKNEKYYFCEDNLFCLLGERLCEKNKPHRLIITFAA